MGYTADDLELDLHTFVARALTQLEGQRSIGVLSMPAPFAPLSTFLRAVPRAFSVMWDEQGVGGSRFAASGVARQVALSGGQRFQQLRSALGALWKQLELIDHPECPRGMPPPRVFGGVSFMPGSTQRAPWQEFTDGRFVLPRWAFGLAEDGFLRLTVDGERDCTLPGRHELLRQLDEIMEALEAYEGQRTDIKQISVHHVDERAVRQLAPEEWDRRVESIRGEIRAGRFKRVVAARRADVTLSRPVDDIEVLTRLASEPQCTRFAFRGPNTSFIGASPEMLVSKKGLQLKTQALAGTLRSLGSDGPLLRRRSEQLLNSKKDQSDHYFVVEDIRESLMPFVTEIDVPERPTVSKIRNILHLNTPITALMREGADVIDVVDTLHPTAAVGGIPKRLAAEWIALHELHPRGWYSGTVGWVDMTGDASFVVAIRCGLITPTHAHIFTAAGIVEDSDGAAEYAATELKMVPMLRALGVVP